MKHLFLCGLLFVSITYAIKTVKPIPSAGSGLRIGTGIFDITGPASEVGMMGYANVGQSTAGLHLRLRARAFVFADQTGKRIVYVSTDSCMIFTSVKMTVVKRLEDLGLSQFYTADNVMLSGTHTHSGPGGFGWFAMYDMTTLGFHKGNFETIVNGIVQAIVMAHNSLSNGGRVLMNSAELYNSSINRSPSAYANNPAAERAKYEYNTDKLMLALRLENENNKAVGHINFFPVHGVCMNNTNYLISGDNKGAASLLFERLENNSPLPGQGPFVAAFGNSNEGDVTPNTLGFFCDDGSPCDFYTSTCNGYSEGCHSYGPAPDNNNFMNTWIIGNNQLKMALNLHDTATTQLSPIIDFIHVHIDYRNISVAPNYTTTGKWETTCPGALGDSFAAGTVDGAGDFDFHQGTNSSKTNPYWNFIASFLSAPSPKQIACQAPKPILLNAGEVEYPSPWVPAILPLQIFRIGELFILGVPGEFTTMSGRRLRDAIKATLLANGAPKNLTVVIAGLTNAYSHYIATYEEYGMQRYEGASTIYGPHTLAAHIQGFTTLAAALMQGKKLPPGPTPKNYSDSTFSFQPGVIEDSHPFFTSFGSVESDAQASYTRGAVVLVSFWGASLRNNYFTNSTFLVVELQQGSQWTVVANDGSWETKLRWERRMLTESLITVEWDIPLDAVPGQYRIRHFGYAKESIFSSTLTPYTGISRTFSVS